MNSLKHTASILSSRLILVLLVLAASGCAVLTNSQIQEVKTFAKAAQQYRILPRTVMESHRDIRFARQSFAASSVSSGPEYWKTINLAVEESNKLSNEAKRAGDALEVLDVYADLLVLLSSGKFTNELEKAATSLGNSLDKAVQTYNKTYKANLTPIGGLAAAVVRGIGGIFIRYRQASLIQHYVTSADKVVEALSGDVERLMDVYLATDPTIRSPDAIAAEADALKVAVIATVSAAQGRLPLATHERVVDTIKRIDGAKQLARAVKTSAQKYRQAHAKLAAVVTRRATLEDRLGEIETLIEEIKASQKLLKDLKK